MNPTCTSRRPAASSASTIRSQAPRVVASGFSQNTCLPAAMAASTYSSCVGPHDVTTTASTPGSLDQGLAGVVHDRTGDAVGDRPSAVEIDVGHRGHPRPGKDRG